MLSGVEQDTSHNRMELQAIIESVRHLETNNIFFSKITFITDSQYAVNIPNRKEKLLTAELKTRRGHDVRHADLVATLIDYLGKYQIEFQKVKAHQKQTETINFNRKIDKVVRALLRSTLKNDGPLL